MDSTSDARDLIARLRNVLVPGSLANERLFAEAADALEAAQKMMGEMSARIETDGRLLAQARNDALEEAAKIAEIQADTETQEYEYGRGWNRACEDIAGAIRERIGK